MAITHFIPEIWDAAILERWTQAVIFPNLVNRSYEGVASKGNTVHITGIVAPEVKDYKAAGRTTSAEAISDTGVDLLIDQEKSFDFYVDDIDRAQAAGSLEAYTNAAGEALAEDSDAFLATLLATNGTPLTGGTPTTGDQAFDLIRDARKAMNKANVPAANRVLAVNAEFDGLLVGADSKLTSFDKSGDAQGLRNATLGMLLDFRVVTTNVLPESDAPAFIAFHQRAAAYVSQIQNTEGLRANDRFADRVRGLHVYGGKVVKPEGVFVFTGA